MPDEFTDEEINNLHTEVDRLKKLLRNIVADVEAMERKAPFEVRNDSSQYWYGGFGSVGFDGENNEDMSFQWPNLGILINKAKELI